MSDVDVIQHLRDNKWSGVVQDVMIDFINVVLKDEGREFLLLKLLLEASPNYDR